MKLRSIVVVFGLVVAAPAAAQTCTFNLCPSGRTWLGGGTDATGPWGSCGWCNWLGYCAHEITRCPTGSTLDVPTGQCTWNVCSGCGGELPLCESPSRFTGSGVDAIGRFAICTIGPVPPGGYLAHSVERCDTGWTLQLATGRCRKVCLADLIIRRTFLRNASGAVVTSVRAFQRYSVCAEVFNAGTSTAGASQLRGGGLGVPTAPTAPTPSLPPGASSIICLSYPTTPSPGTWRTGLEADFANAVGESIEVNNSATVTVVVTP